jgi:hypothetical protein
MTEKNSKTCGSLVPEILADWVNHQNTIESAVVACMTGKTLLERFLYVNEAWRLDCECALVDATHAAPDFVDFVWQSAVAKETLFAAFCARVAAKFDPKLNKAFLVAAAYMAQSDVYAAKEFFPPGALCARINRMRFDHFLSVPV